MLVTRTQHIYPQHLFRITNSSISTKSRYTTAINICLILANNGMKSLACQLTQPHLPYSKFKNGWLDKEILNG